MKRKKRTQNVWVVGLIAILTIVGLGLSACEDPCVDCLAIGATGQGGGKIIYHNHAGFTVTGAGSFTAYYLEAASTIQAYAISWSSTNVDVSGATGTAIGTGKANTAAIIAAHSGDTASNNAAKAANITIGGKSDWFLPSKDELNQLYRARNHFGISSDEWIWSSSQTHTNLAWYQKFTGDQGEFPKSTTFNVRAVRAF